MWNQPSPQELQNLPPLYYNEEHGIFLPNIIIHMHFFLGNCDWYIAEANGGRMWGYAILNRDFDNAEWGYMDFEEIKTLRSGAYEVENDLHWTPKSAAEVEKIRMGMDWPKPNPSVEIHAVATVEIISPGKCYDTYEHMANSLGAKKWSRNSIPPKKGIGLVRAMEKHPSRNDTVCLVDCGGKEFLMSVEALNLIGPVVKLKHVPTLKELIQ